MTCGSLWHAWKACNRQNRFGGSNPPLSAKTLINKRILTKTSFGTLLRFGVMMGKIHRK